MKKIFNPLDSIPEVTESVSTSSTNISESALYNELIGVCPKCNSPMTTSTIANGDTVFFCLKDRVALPQPNSSEGQ